MRLTKKAIRLIKASPTSRPRLALALECSVYTIDRYLKDNDDNLTKAAALVVIREETELTDEEILEVEPVSRG